MRRSGFLVLRTAYSLLGYLLLPAVFLRLFLRGFKAPAYRRRWRERLGFAPLPTLSGAIWVHAVSVGEVEAAVPLVRSLRERFPQRPLVVTTTTPTGSDRVRARLGGAVYHSYLPYDLPGPLGRFLGTVRPHLVIVMETELWPNLFAACARRGIPLVVANARVSAGSFRGYRKLRALLQPTLRSASRILAQTGPDAERLAALGADRAALEVAGNLKYDLELAPDLAAKGRELRGFVGAERPVWVAGSTHAGEENAVLGAHESVRRRHPRALLILVPRHPERFEEVADMCGRRGLATARRSRGARPGREDEVYLADTMGELMTLYAASDVAFVGGSLEPVGGHNLLEPAAVGLPILTGPHLANFREIAERVQSAGAARVVRSSAELGDAAAALLADPESRTAMGGAGRQVVAANQGARERVLAVAEALLDPRG